MTDEEMAAFLTPGNFRAYLSAPDSDFMAFCRARNAYYREYVNMALGDCPDTCRAYGIDPASRRWHWQ